MTLETVYYITQIIAVGAILASLVAIYSQINQQNQISRFNATRDLINQFNDLNSLIITDASLRQTMHKETPLSDDEQRQIYPYVASRANIWASTQWAYDTANWGGGLSGHRDRCSPGNEGIDQFGGHLCDVYQ